MPRAAESRIGGHAKRKGWTQGSLGAALEPPVTQSTIQRWFQADVIPSEYQQQVARLLEVRLEWLITGEGPVEEPPQAQRDRMVFQAGRVAGLRDAAAILGRAIADAETAMRAASGGTATLAQVFDELARIAAATGPHQDDSRASRRDTA